jgi:hypothetical protein
MQNFMGRKRALEEKAIPVVFQIFAFKKRKCISIC